MKKLLVGLYFLSLAIPVSLGQSGDTFEPARIYKAMEKGRNGEDLKIGVIGGSITEGYAASSTNKRWANLMADWWKGKFPASKVELINAGWGGTGSDIGAHRAYDDLLVQNPDFVMIEFAVNDTEGDLAVKMMEGLVQQILSAENHPGVMMLLLKQDNGTTAQASHKKVGEYYGVPMVSFADLIDAKVAEDGVELSSIFVDGLHPNDAGMAYIAGFISDKLDSLYTQFEVLANLPEIVTGLPAPLVTNTYSQTYQFFSDIIIPLSNTGWDITQSGWISETVDNQIDFQVMGNAFSLVFTQNDDANRGKAEVWVDEGEKTVIDAYMNEDWGTRYAFALIQEGLADGNHILHIRNISQTSTSGHYVHIARVLTAGNVGSAAPIAITGSHQKGVVGRTTDLIGSESYDPDGEAITKFSWTIENKPAGSSASIDKADENVAKLTPDIAGEYTIKLIVSAGSNESVPAIKKLNVRAVNNIPVAIPGNDTLSALNKYFKFDGTKSYDADGDALTYKWELESAPDGSTTDILKSDGDKPQCKFYVEGDYVISLVVSDSIDFSEKAFIKVTAIDGFTDFKMKSGDEKSLKVYPNPSTNEVAVQYFAEADQPVLIEVYSIIGTKLAEFVPTKNVLGKNIFVFNLRDFTKKSGIYLVKVFAGNTMEIKRLTLI